MLINAVTLKYPYIEHRLWWSRVWITYSRKKPNINPIICWTRAPMKYKAIYGITSHHPRTRIVNPQLLVMKILCLDKVKSPLVLRGTNKRIRSGRRYHIEYFYQGSTKSVTILFSTYAKTSARYFLIDFNICNVQSFGCIQLFFLSSGPTPVPIVPSNKTPSLNMLTLLRTYHNFLTT